MSFFQVCYVRNNKMHKKIYIFIISHLPTVILGLVLKLSNWMPKYLFYKYKQSIWYAASISKKKDIFLHAEVSDEKCFLLCLLCNNDDRKAWASLYGKPAVKFDDQLSRSLWNERSFRMQEDFFSTRGTPLSLFSLIYTQHLMGWVGTGKANNIGC